MSISFTFSHPEQPFSTSCQPSAHIQAFIGSTATKLDVFSYFAIAEEVKKRCPVTIGYFSTKNV